MFVPASTWAQEGGSGSTSEESSSSQAADSGAVSTQDTKATIQEKVSEIGDAIDQNETAQEVSKSILDPIYQLSEFLAFSAFYWVAFALMVAGVVSYAGQLVLSKFFLLFKFSLNFKEILGDLLGLVVALVGLVLTTQAATENSTFTQSPFAVISAALVGAIVGFVFYLWGQSTEFSAVAGERAEQKTRSASDR